MTRIFFVIQHSNNEALVNSEWAILIAFTLKILVLSNPNVTFETSILYLLCSGAEDRCISFSNFSFFPSTSIFPALFQHIIWNGLIRPPQIRAFLFLVLNLCVPICALELSALCNGCIVVFCEFCNILCKIIIMF